YPSRPATPSRTGPLVERHTRTSQVKALPPEVVSVSPPGQDSRSRASYGTPQVSLPGASSTGWSNDKLALPVERPPLEKDQHHRRPIATESASTAITYATPDLPACPPLRK